MIQSYIFWICNPSDTHKSRRCQYSIMLKTTRSRDKYDTFIPCFQQWSDFARQRDWQRVELVENGIESLFRSYCPHTNRYSKPLVPYNLRTTS